jgi:hypothetical protein
MERGGKGRRAPGIGVELSSVVFFPKDLVNAFFSMPANICIVA